jgi:hypothetical protein
VAVRDPHNDLPEAFARAVASLAPVRMRSEIRLAEAPAPQRLAPFAIAMTADVTDNSGDDTATGRFVVLHDPAGQEAWQGSTRIVAYVRAELEPEMASDPFLAAVAWTWLTEGLARRLPGLAVRALGGTVTRVSSECFGTMAGRPSVAHVELRVSWTPEGDDLGPHLEAWGDVLASAAGLAPLPPGVAALPSRRR